MYIFESVYGHVLPEQAGVSLLYVRPYSMCVLTLCACTYYVCVLRTRAAGTGRCVLILEIQLSMCPDTRDTALYMCPDTRDTALCPTVILLLDSIGAGGSGLV